MIAQFEVILNIIGMKDFTHTIYVRARKRLGTCSATKLHFPLARRTKSF